MRQALEMALEALQMLHDENMDYLTRNKLGGENNQCMVFARETITAIKEALAQLEQEPVAYGTWDTMLGKGHRMMMVRLDKGQDGCTVPLYTTPPQRKPLTENEIKHLWYEACQTNLELTSQLIVHLARAIEAAHNIKELKNETSIRTGA